VLRGVVHDDAGLPIRRAFIRLQLHEETCGERQLAQAEGAVTTDDSGQFRVQLTALLTPFLAQCLTVATDSTRSPGLPSVSKQVAVSLPFGARPPDSINVSVTLPFLIKQ